MDILIVYPDTKEQLSALNAVMKAMNIRFELKSGIYSDYVEKGVRESIAQADEGLLMPYTGIRDMLDLV
jgi:hypothetical protein